MNTLSKYWWVALVRGIILIALAFFVMRHPVGTLVGVAVYIGFSLLIAGVVQAFVSFGARETLPNWGWGVAGGLVDVLFGSVLLTNPGLTAATIPLMVGLWLIFSGVMSFVNSFQLKKDGYANWWADMISGLLSVLVGYVMVNDLLAGALTITIWMAIGFLLAGIVNILLAVGTRSLRH